MPKTTLNVKGMHCKSCVFLISDALQEAGAKDVHVTLDASSKLGTVSADTSLSKEELKKIIESQGNYEVA